MVLVPALLAMVATLKFRWSTPPAEWNIPTEWRLANLDYQDTYYTTHSVGWTGLTYIAFVLILLGSGLWLLRKTKRG